MPSASVSATNMNNLVRDTYQANSLLRSHQQPIASSQTSLQKLPASSPQILYPIGTNPQSQPPHNMQFPPPPLMNPMGVPVQATNVPKNDATINPYNPIVAPHLMNINHTTLMAPSNGLSNQHTQSTILMSPTLTNKEPQASNLSTYYAKHQHQYQQLIQHQPQYSNTQRQQDQHQQQQQQQQPQHQQQLQHQHQQQQHQHQLTPGLSMGSLMQQQQVPLTTLMIPASAASQIQSASIQIQQAAMQAMATNPGQPQILVFMIPYMYNQPPTIPPTPEQPSLNSTLVRQSQSSTLNRPPPQQQQNISAPANSRAVSSLSSAKQDSEKFYIKANFSYHPNSNKMELMLTFQKGDILHVLDTLQNNDYGQQYWLATRLTPSGESEKGLIPDKNKADEIALEAGQGGGTLDASSSGVLSASVGRVNFLKRRAAQRSKSLCKDNWDNVVFDIGSCKLPAYERVVYKHPGFCRPVVVFGPLADVAREKLLKDYPEKYSYPTGFHQSQDHPKVIRLKGILEVIDQGKHALLDITPSAVEKLNYVNLAPIVIFMKTDSKSIIKEFRSRAVKSLDPNAKDEDTLRRDGKSSRKLLEQSMKLEKMWYHVFTATLNLSTMGSEMWYRKLRETIENQQSANVWMNEKKSDKKVANTSHVGDMMLSVSDGQSSSHLEPSSSLHERFNESLNITSKSTIDLLPEGTYGNRSQQRNAYAHSLAQKLARASSEPKLNGLMSENEDDDEDDDDDEEIIKKPFPSEFENSSSISSSNGATSYGQGSMTGTSMSFQNYPPQTKSDLGLNKGQDSIYSRNPVVNSTYSNGNGSNRDYHALPPMMNPDENGYHNQSMSNVNNNVIDLSRNHETRGSAFQVYSDMNQNNYHYYNLNKI